MIILAAITMARDYMLRGRSRRSGNIYTRVFHSNLVQAEAEFAYMIVEESSNLHFLELYMESRWEGIEWQCIYRIYWDGDAIPMAT